jgi:outer membrane scaffolding protein for murein synthesis (MipA/OmpV family)
MANLFLLAAALTSFALPAVAGGYGVAGAEPVVMAPAPVDTGPDLVFTLRGGASLAPAYFGASKLKAGPDFGFALNFTRLPMGRSIGSADPKAESYGFSPRGSFRVISKRSAADNVELTGMTTVKTAVELGMGLGYTHRNFEAFADLRYGAIGHKGFVGELGADVVMRPTDKLTVKFGPRAFFGNDKYAATYFGVTAAEASPTSAFTAYTAKGGMLSAGVELGATYAINDDWGVDGALRWDAFTNSAKSSPIVTQGRTNNVSLRLGVTRRISLKF